MGQDGETLIVSCTSEVQAYDCLLISAGAQTIGDAASLRISPPKIMLVKSVPMVLGRQKEPFNEHIKRTKKMKELSFSAYPLSTENFGLKNRVKGQTVRKQYCIAGSYYGVKPLKLANRRLAWPDVVVTSTGVLEA